MKSSPLFLMFALIGLFAVFGAFNPVSQNTPTNTNQSMENSYMYAAANTIHIFHPDTVLEPYHLNLGNVSYLYTTNSKKVTVIFFKENKFYNVLSPVGISPYIANKITINVDNKWNIESGFTTPPWLLESLNNVLISGKTTIPPQK